MNKYEDHFTLFVRLTLFVLLLLSIASVQTFSQTVPATPSPSSPTNAATNQPVHVTFSWAASAHAVIYRLQVATVTSFPDSSIVLDTTIADNGLLTITFTTDSLNYATKYYWRLNASSADSTSGWSTVFNFTTVIAPPATPVLTVPFSYGCSIAVSSTFKWNTVPSAATYQIQIDTLSSFSTPTINDSTLTTGSKAVTSLLYYHRYYWRVRAKNVGGTSAWSEAHTFLTQLPPPVLFFPSTASTNQPTSPNLIWNPTDSAQGYTLQISTSSTFASFVLVDSSLTDPYLHVEMSLINNTKYYWRVSAKNDSCTSQFQTTPFSFTTIIAAPASTPVLTAPTNAAVNQSITPVLKWNAVTGATSYQVQIGTDSLYTRPIKDTTITAATFTPSGLKNYTRYFWHVSAVNVGGSSNYSSSQYFTTELTQPALIFPANNTTNFALPPTFIWSSATSALRYHLQVSTVSTFASIAFQDSTLTDTTDTPVSLLNSTTYYWRVRAKNDTCVSSWITTAPKFTTIIATPIAPVLNSPAAGTINDTITPTLKWATSTGSSFYRVQVSTDNLFSALVLNDSVTTTSKTLTTLSYNTLYYWRVNAQNVGGTSPYSATWNFTTTLAAPALFTPVNLATNEPINEIFSWSTVPGATSYHLFLGTDSLFKTISYDLPSLKSTTDTVRNISNTMKYYWKVKAANANGEGIASSVWSFTTITLAPPAPALTAPTDTAGNQPISILLQWNSLYNAATYRLQVSTDSLFGTTIFDDTTLTVTQKQISGLVYNTRYFWRVRGKNSYGPGNYTCRSFYTTMIAPALSSPASGASSQPISISFVWDSIPGATYYTLQLSTSSTFTTLSFVDSLITTTTRTVASLANSTKYYWRVCARNSRGSGAFATASSFTTVIPAPAASKLSTPANNALNQAQSIAFKWNTATSATSYQLQVATDSFFVSCLYDTSTTLLTTTLTMPLTSLTYYWRVFAKNVGGSSPSSEVWKLTTITVPPVSPQLASPKSGKLGITTTTMLTWHSVWSAKKYLVQIATDSPFDSITVSTNVSLDTMLQVSTLANGTLYYWRVKAANDSGSSDYSAVWNFTTRLQTPTLQFPYSTSEGISLSPTLKWSAVQKVWYYVVQLSTDSLFTHMVVNDSTVTTLTYPLAGLQTNTKYYWRVGAKDITGYTALSDVSTFTTIPPALQAPILISPLSAISNVSLNPVFKWHSVPGATLYQLQVSEDTPFKTLISDSTLRDTSIQLSALQFGKTYYWRVKSLNSSDTSLYSNIWSFATTTGIPPTPIQKFPANLSTNLPRRFTFQWSAVAMAATYHLQIAQDLLFTDLIFQDSTLVDTTIIGPPLDYGKQYYWRVQAANSVGKGSFSTIWYFSTTEGQLSAPTLSAPINTAMKVATSPVLIWNKVLRAALYQVQIAEDVQFYTIVFQDTSDIDTLSQGASLQNNKSYYWRVRAISHPDTSGFSTTWSFTTIIAPPSVPVLFEPINNAYGVGLNTTLIWKKLSQTEVYDLQVTDDALFRTLVFEDSTLTDTSCYVGPLHIYTRYYWRVKAKNYAGASSFCSSWTFSTAPSTGIQTIGSAIPKEIFLRQNYPNPFNPSTIIEFGLSEESYIDIAVYNVLGKVVSTILSQQLPAGYYQLPWRADHLANGVYFYRMVVRPLHTSNSTRTFMQTKKLILLK